MPVKDWWLARQRVEGQKKRASGRALEVREPELKGWT